MELNTKKIRWDDIIYSAPDWEHLLEKILSDEWIGNLRTLELRIDKYYNETLDVSSAENTFKHLARLGEITIL